MREHEKKKILLIIIIPARICMYMYYVYNDV